MPKYRTREAYWKAHGWSGLASEVGRRTAAELKEKGIKPDPESSVYKKTFDRLSAVYRDEQAVKKKQRKKEIAAWLEQHRDDSDEQLLQYLRETVSDPAQFEKASDVLGGTRIAARFGGWQKALIAAGLAEPKE